MRLTPTEMDRLTIFTAAELARRRRAKGWKLTHPEALAIICDEMHEAARGGAPYEEVMRSAVNVLTTDDVLDGVPSLIGAIKIACLCGDAMRWRPGERQVVRLVAFGGRGVIRGFNHLTDGPATPERLAEGLERVRRRRYGHRGGVSDGR